jgi:hypothetical protein
LHDPYLMKDMEKSSHVWKSNRKWGKYSCFFERYDVDGLP